MDCANIKIILIPYFEIEFELKARAYVWSCSDCLVFDNLLVRRAHFIIYYFQVYDLL